MGGVTVRPVPPQKLQQRAPNIWLCSRLSQKPRKATPSTKSSSYAKSGGHAPISSSHNPLLPLASRVHTGRSKTPSRRSHRACLRRRHLATKCVARRNPPVTLVAVKGGLGLFRQIVGQGGVRFGAAPLGRQLGLRLLNWKEEKEGRVAPRIQWL